MAALSSINPELHEAAVMDGANKFQRIWHVDIPGILPTIVIMFILNSGKVMAVGFEKAYLSCFKDIALKDTVSLETDINELCKAHVKRKDFGMTAFTRGFCIEAHAIYNMLNWVYGGELKDRVKMPDQKNFCQELAIWQNDHNNEHGKVVTKYPDELDIFNKMLYCDPPRMYLINKGKERFIDVDRFAGDVASRIQEMGETLQKKKVSPFGKLLQKIKGK